MYPASFEMCSCLFNTNYFYICRTENICSSCFRELVLCVLWYCGINIVFVSVILDKLNSNIFYIEMLGRQQIAICRLSFGLFDCLCIYLVAFQLKSFSKLCGWLPFPGFGALDFLFHLFLQNSWVVSSHPCLERQ